MIKVVLIGGLPSTAPDGGRALDQELVKGLNSPVKWLDILFARPHAQWEESVQSDREWLATNVPDVEIQVEAATSSGLIDQIKAADVIYLKGGDTAPLLKELQAQPNWVNHLDGKVVAGSSAGAYALASAYHELDNPRIGHGFGLVKVKLATHWESKLYNADWDQVKRDLELANPDLPLLLQREGEYKIFEVALTPVSH